MANFVADVVENAPPNRRAGYRIGLFEVESAIVAHEAIAEAAVVAAPDDERGSIVRAVVVLRDGAPTAGMLSACDRMDKWQTVCAPRLIRHYFMYGMQ